MYHLVQPATGELIYVHAKVMIVDDVYASIGSQNINVRSMTHDTEIGVSVVDADVLENGTCRFAHSLRRTLWGEHLGLLPDDPLLEDPVVGVTEWDRQAATATVRVRRHITPSPQRELAALWSNTHDPSGHC